MGGTQEAWRRVVQSGVIKHFEFTYELSWLFIKRWLEANVSPNAGDGVARRELFRLDAENLLIDDVDRWMRYHQARNRTFIYTVRRRPTKYAQSCRVFWMTLGCCSRLWRLGMIDAKPEQLAEISAVLEEFVPGWEVRAFGSRVKSAAKPWSDLDLAVAGPSPMGWQNVERLI